MSLKPKTFKPKDGEPKVLARHKDGEPKVLARHKDAFIAAECKDILT